MSAFPPKADIERHDGHVRFVPKADIRTAATRILFDHLVCAEHEPGRNLMTDRLRSLEIDDQLELSWLFDGQIGGFRPAQSLDELPSQQITKELDDARAVPDEASLLRHFGPLVNRGQAQRPGLLNNHVPIGEEDRRRQYIECSSIRSLRGIDC